MNSFTTARTLLTMTRPWNWLRMQVPATLLGVLAGLYERNPEQVTMSTLIVGHARPILLAAVTVACISAGGYVVNDYFDRDIDAINEPNRPIPSGRVTSRQALGALVALFGLGLLSAYFIGLPAFIIGAVWVVFAIGYAYTFKRRGYGLESLTFGVVMSMTALFGSASVLDRLSDVPTLLLAAFITLYITAAHITGTLKDVRGDMVAGCRTLAVLLGEGKTRVLIPVVYMSSFAVLLFAVRVYLRLNVVLFVLVVITLGGILLANLRLLGGGTRESVAKALSQSKTFLHAIFVLLGIHFVLGK